MNNTLRMGAVFVAGVALSIVGGTYAFMGNAEVQQAIEDNDYTTFQEVAPERLLEKVDSAEAFDEFVAKHESMQQIKESTQSAILAAVQANDYAAFQTAHDAMRDQMEALRPDDAPEMHQRPELTEEQQAELEAKHEAKFDSLVEYYEANGELPERTEGHGFGKMGKHGGHGGCAGKNWGDQPQEE